MGIGMTEEEMQKLSVDENSMSGTCPICLCELSGKRVRVLPCCHGFHEDCIFEWLKINVTCPNCRYALKEVPQDDYLTHELMIEPITNANILRGTLYHYGPWANTRSQISARFINNSSPFGI